MSASPPSWRPWLLVGALVLIGAVLQARGQRSSLGPSAANRGLGGLAAAVGYLEEQGYPVHRGGRPLNELPTSARAVWMALPGARAIHREEEGALRRHLLGGGGLLLMLNRDGLGEGQAPLPEFLELELERLDLGSPPDWAGLARWALREQEDPLLPEGQRVRSQAPLHELRLRPGREPWIPGTGSDRARAWLSREHQGPVLVFDTSSFFSNEYLPRGDNLELLERAVEAVGGREGLWVDEWRHGQTDPSGDQTAAERTLAFDLLMGHLALLWAATIWLLARRSGPTPAAAPLARSSVSRDLAVLAELHARAGNSAEAGQLLLELARRGARQPALVARALPEAFTGGPEELLALARTVADLQRQRLL